MIDISYLYGEVATWWHQAWRIL